MVVDMFPIFPAFQREDPPGWFPAGADWYTQFQPHARSYIEMSTYNSLTDLIASAHASFTRSTVAIYQDSDGDFVSHAVDDPRNGDQGILIEPAGTRVTVNPDTPDTDWSTVGGASKVALSGTFLGLFSDATTVSSGGANWHAIKPTDFSLTSGTEYDIVVLARSGTSGKLRIIVKYDAGGLESRITGTIGSGAVDVSLAGTISIESQVQHTDGTYEYHLKFTPDTTGGHSLRVGPDSSTSGENVSICGGYINSGGVKTPNLISPGSGNISTGSDVFTVFPQSGTYDITVTFDDDSTQLLSGQVITGSGWQIPTNLNRPYIKNITATEA